MRTAITVVATAALVALGGCDSARSDADGRIDVVAAFYPLQFLAERIGGDRVRVTSLAQPGVEPHDLELKPKQVAALQDADLVLQLAGFQPAVDEAIADTGKAKDRAYDVAAVEALLAAPEEAEEHGEEEKEGKEHANEGKDLHLWLDPLRFAALGDQIAERLAKLDSAAGSGFRDRAKALRAELTALDGEYAKGLAACQRREIVTSHSAFGYLAARYKLTQIPITGLSPEDEPTPQRVTEVAALAKQKGVTTIFFETLVSPKIAQTLATEVGAKAEVLDPIEGLQAGAGGDYLSLMRQNLGKLRPALGCT